MLGNRRTNENSFDDMLATLKDKVSSVQEKEFIDDLYFIKKQGNLSVHSVKVKSDGMLALECLQRAFEIALNYAVYYKRANSEIMKYRYDTELLVTGESSVGKNSLKNKYKNLNKKVKSTPKENKKTKTIKTYNKKNHIIFKIFMCVSAVGAIFLLISLYYLSVM